MATMQLTKISAFGFPNKNWSETEVYEKFIEGQVKFFSPNKQAEIKKDFMGKRMQRGNTINKIISYVPLLSIFSGLNRSLYFCSKETRKFISVHFVTRACFEFLSIGIVLLPVDIIATLVKNEQAKKLQAKTA